MEVFKESINVIIGGISMVLGYFLGDFWWLFAAFSALNIVDYITGWYKARYTKTVSSAKGAHGIAKKAGYWVILGISFFVAVSFVEMGAIMGVNLSFLTLLGYFTLFTYIVNEIRSIIENLVVCGVAVPDILINSLHITEKLLSDKAKEPDDTEL